MKKIALFLILSVCAACLTGCQFVPETIMTLSDYTDDYVYSIEYDGDSVETISLGIDRKDHNSPLTQTITLPPNESCTQSPIYFWDINFDGDADLVVPLSRSAYGIYCAAYAFESQTGQFTAVEGFETIANPSMDYKNKQLLSHTSGDKTVSYLIYEYQPDGSLQNTHSLSWTPDDTRGETEITVRRNDVVIKTVAQPASEDPYSLDSADPEIAPYFEPGSLWDLNGDKWDSPLLTEIR